MNVKRLEKLQKHLETLHLVKTRVRDRWGNIEIVMKLPKTKQDNTRFSINNWEFDCGMPSCVAGHAKSIFNWRFFGDWDYKFKEFFDLSREESDWVCSIHSYKSLNPTPKTASKHIRDVLIGKF